MNQEPIPLYHRLLGPIVGLSICMSLIPGVHAARPATTLAEQFAARAVSVAGEESAGRVDVLIEQWSTDAEVTRLHDALQKGDTAALITLLHQQKRRVGVVLMPGIQAHGARARTRTPKNLLFARQITTPAGRQIIAVADEHLGLGEPALEARKPVQEFNLLEIRIGADGTGIGKVLSASDVAFNAKSGVLEAKDFAAHPARLVDVRADKP